MGNENSNEVKEVAKEIVGWEDKIWATVKDLTISPGETVRLYCIEKKSYLSPVLYYFIVSGIYYFFIGTSGLEEHYIKDATEFFSKALGNSSVNNKFFHLVAGGLGEKVIIVPGILLLQWLFFKGFNSSFKENAWFVLFIEAHATWLSGFEILAWWTTKNIFLIKTISYVTDVATLSYAIWATKQFYPVTLVRSIILNLAKFFVLGAFVAAAVLGLIMLFIFYNH